MKLKVKCKKCKHNETIETPAGIIDQKKDGRVFIERGAWEETSQGFCSKCGHDKLYKVKKI